MEIFFYEIQEIWDIGKIREHREVREKPDIGQLRRHWEILDSHEVQRRKVTFGKNQGYQKILEERTCQKFWRALLEPQFEIFPKSDERRVLIV